jgi:hypothetical protein
MQGAFGERSALRQGHLRQPLALRTPMMATVAVLEHFAQAPAAGHLLVALTGDEEAGSQGIRALARFLVPYLAQEGLDIAGIDLVTPDIAQPRRHRLVLWIGRQVFAARIFFKQLHFIGRRLDNILHQSTHMAAFLIGDKFTIPTDLF